MNCRIFSIFEALKFVFSCGKKEKDLWKASPLRVIQRNYKLLLYIRFFQTVTFSLIFNLQ